MKKLLLSMGLGLVLMIAQAQQNPRRAAVRPEVAELQALKDTKEVEKRLKKLTASKTEDHLEIAYTYYLAAEGGGEKADRVKALAIKKFPKGKFVLSDKINKVRSIENLNTKDSLFQTVYKEFPDGSYTFLPYELALEFSIEGNEKKTAYYQDLFFKQLESDPNSTVDRDNIERMFAGYLAARNPVAALPKLQRYVVEDYDRLQVLKSLPEADTKELEKLESRYFSTRVSYLSALVRYEKSEEAYALVKKFYEEQMTDNGNERMKSQVSSLFLDASLLSSHYEGVLPLMEAAIRAGRSNEQIDRHLKSAYVTAYGSDEGFATYEAGLIAAQEERVTSELKKKFVNEEAPDFVLKDVEGNVVKLSDYRGKLVFLDFWATWCGPCKASFPAMQAAVDHFKDNSDVVFLFIHTWERGRGDATTEAKAYVTDNKYSFHVLMDTKDLDTKTNKAAVAYQLQGIPAKFAIDRHGKIRYKNTGSSTDPKSVVREITKIFELIDEG